MASLARNLLQGYRAVLLFFRKSMEVVAQGTKSSKGIFGVNFPVAAEFLLASKENLNSTVAFHNCSLLIESRNGSGGLI